MFVMFELKNKHLIKFLKKVVPFYREKKQLEIGLLSTLSKDGIWIYSLKKSGTTYTALFLSNYVNYCMGNKEAVSFDEMNMKYCVHSIDSKLKADNILQLHRENVFIKDQYKGYRSLFTTHRFIEGGFWSKNICLYRNPLDYIISSYFFQYVNRGKKMAHPRNIIDEKVEEFSLIINKQKELEKNFPDKVLRVAYSELMREPENTFSKMVNFLELEYDKNALTLSIQNSSKKKVKEMESERGEAIVKKPGVKFKGSFVRSGKIGEWKDYFNDQDLKNIEEKLNHYNLSLKEFVLE